MQTFALPIISLAGLGAVFLYAALLGMQRIIQQTPSGALRGHWRLLRAFAALFLGADLLYALSCVLYPVVLRDLLASLIFFGGSLFVLLSTRLFLRTAHDIRRLAHLERVSVTDVLTRTYNRRHIEDNLPRLCEEARRRSQDLSVMLVDIDYFKSINDTYGHPAGDQILREVANLLREHTRAGDIVARYGGEEFLIVMPRTDPASALVLAERLRSAVARAPFAPSEDCEPVRLSVSIGLGWLDASCASSEDLVAATDEHLYEAKRGGRNCVHPTAARRQ